jgi:cytochrome o ubiquinol oxidase subunit 1
MNADLVKLIFGKLTWDVVPFGDPILLATFAMVALGGIGLLAALTYYRLWTPLWRDWITTVDHKRIGIMYIVLALIMLIRGFVDACLMRLQQAMAFGDNVGFLPPHHYDQLFTVHGVIMIFFVAMPLVIGLMNFAVPLQIGARDMAFPWLNSLGFGSLLLAQCW